MDERQRKQIELIASYELDSTRKAVELESRAIYAAHSAKGMLGSGATVTVITSAIGEASKRLLDSLIERVGAVSRSPAAMDLIAATIRDHFANMEGTTLQSARMASRRTTGDPDPRILKAAQDRLEQVKADIAARMEIERFGFEGQGHTPAARAIPQELTAKSVPKNTGGRPLAGHWDQMWAAIAYQLWNGDLNPTRQKDITDAMLAWFVDHEIDIGPTAVTERARALWLQIEAKRLS